MLVFVLLRLLFLLGSAGFVVLAFFCLFLKGGDTCSAGLEASSAGKCEEDGDGDEVEKGAAAAPFAATAVGGVGRERFFCAAAAAGDCDELPAAAGDCDGLPAAAGDCDGPTPSLRS